jgi:hypothetical protein
MWLRSEVFGQAVELKNVRADRADFARQLALEEQTTAALKNRTADKSPMSSLEEYLRGEAEEAIVSALNEEIHIHTAAKHEHETTSELKRHDIRSIIRTVMEDNESTRNDLEHIRNIITQCDCEFEKEQKAVGARIDELIGWLEFVMGDWKQKDDEMWEEATAVCYTHIDECEDRIRALTNLSMFCGVRERLDMDLTDNEEDDD